MTKKTAKKMSEKPKEIIQEVVLEEKTDTQTATHESDVPDSEKSLSEETQPTDLEEKSQEVSFDQIADQVGKICIVIPYLKSRAQGNELLYAVRSIAKNFKDKVLLVVIGDKEDWFSDEILYLDHQCIGNNPQADVIDKIRQLVINEDIPEAFVWSNDDIYFVSPVSIDDLLVRKTCGNLVNLPSDHGTYSQNRLRTINMLRMYDLPIMNYACHMPVVYEKEKIAELFETFPELNAEGVLFSSLYFNFHVDPEAVVEHHDWKTDKWCLRVISALETPEKKDVFRSLIGSKKFLNHSESGFSKLLMGWIDKQFNEKCIFEK